MTKQEVANLLVSHKCVVVSPSDPFTYASGLKGPIYCDNRQVLSHPKARGQVVEAFIQAIKDSGVEFDSVAGLATAGIPHAALIADRLNLPMIYVRGKAKGHGKQNQVEGAFKEGDRVILIEDLVNQGSSLADAMEGLLAAGLKPQACFSIVDYQMAKAKEVLEKYNLPLVSLTDFETIAGVSREGMPLSDEEYQLLLKWQENPAQWQPAG